MMAPTVRGHVLDPAAKAEGGSSDGQHVRGDGRDARTLGPEHGNLGGGTIEASGMLRLTEGAGTPRVDGGRGVAEF
jgi:hypothetical protein